MQHIHKKESNRRKVIAVYYKLLGNLQSDAEPHERKPIKMFLRQAKLQLGKLVAVLSCVFWSKSNWLWSWKFAWEQISTLNKGFTAAKGKCTTQGVTESQQQLQDHICRFISSMSNLSFRLKHFRICSQDFWRFAWHLVTRCISGWRAASMNKENMWPLVGVKPVDVFD